MTPPSPTPTGIRSACTVALTVALLAAGPRAALAQGPLQVPGPAIEEPAGAFTGMTYVPRLPQRPGDGARQSTFVVTYNGFTPQAQAAFQMAVDIWSGIVQSSVPIRVTAYWRADLPAGVLGAAGPTMLVRDFANAPAAGTYYPVALGNALAGTDLYPASDDIVASFNANFGWYLGLDGNAGQRFDLVTIVLHELAHGLGFVGSMNYANGIGWWGAGGLPFIYDRLAINGGGQYLTDTATFPNNSAQLGAQLTSSSVYFNGSLTRSRNGNAAPVLYAPPNWVGGSSISHVDDATYPSGTLDSLMTPSVSPGEVVHEPGPIARGVLADIGWALSGASGCTYLLGTPSATVGAATATGTVAVTADPGCPWTAASNSGFIGVTAGAAGNGNGTVSFAVNANTAAPNVATPTRAGAITIAGQTFSITQTGCGFSVSPLAATFTPAGGSGALAVTASAGCSWTASAAPSYLTITSGASGIGSGTVSYALAANTAAPNAATAARTAALTAAGHVQPLAQGGCAFGISPGAEWFSGMGGAGSVVVTTSPSCPWNVSSLPAWASPGITSGLGAGTLTYTIASNAGGATRSQQAMVAGQSYTLTQLGAPVTAMVSGRRSSVPLASAAAVRWASIDMIAGRSYCAQVGSGPAATTRGTPTLVAYRADAASVLGTAGTRTCFVAPASERALLKLTQSDTSARAYRLAVDETTLWGHWFFAGGDYHAFTLLRNTTDAPIAAVITWRDTGGAVAGTASVVVPPQGIVLRNARDVVAGTPNGSVEIAHAGPPQSIVGTETMLSATSGLSFDVLLSERRAW